MNAFVLTSPLAGVMLLTRRQPFYPSAAHDKFFSICTAFGGYTEFGIAPRFPDSSITSAEKPYMIPVAAGLSIIGVMTCLIAGFFCRPTRRLTSIICKICAMRLKPLRFAGMLGQRGSSRVLCRMSCHCRSCKASLPILSAAALFRMTFAQSRLFTRVSTHLIHRATIRILTSSCQPVPSSQMASAG